jgi:hypothetical protein
LWWTELVVICNAIFIYYEPRWKSKKDWKCIVSERIIRCAFLISGFHGWHWM